MFYQILDEIKSDFKQIKVGKCAAGPGTLLPNLGEYAHVVAKARDEYKSWSWPSQLLTSFRNSIPLMLFFVVRHFQMGGVIVLFSTCIPSCITIYVPPHGRGMLATTDVCNRG